jgi:hypothetical protein
MIATRAFERSSSVSEKLKLEVLLFPAYGTSEVTSFPSPVCEF